MKIGMKTLRRRARAHNLRLSSMGGKFVLFKRVEKGGKAGWVAVTTKIPRPLAEIAKDIK